MAREGSQEARLMAFDPGALGNQQPRKTHGAASWGSRAHSEKAPLHDILGAGPSSGYRDAAHRLATPG
jgi:hypothetical protein